MSQSHEVGAQPQCDGEAVRQTHEASTDLHTVALQVSYNGSSFNGFAKQPGQPTVQGGLEEALGLLYRRPVETVCAGRTDSGVHALGQVVSFQLSPDEFSVRGMDKLAASLRALTPDGMTVRAAAEAPKGFSARFDAVSREYRYFICIDAAAPLLMAGFCWHLGKSLDVDAMRRGASHLIGEHDFKSFCAAASAVGKPTHRFVKDIEFLQRRIWDSEFVEMRIVGNAFLHSMVRTIVGTLVAVGRGKRAPEWVAQVLAARERSAAGENAPAEGLVFWHVDYKGQWLYVPPTRP